MIKLTSQIKKKCVNIKFIFNVYTITMLVGTKKRHNELCYVYYFVKLFKSNVFYEWLLVVHITL